MKRSSTTFRAFQAAILIAALAACSHSSNVSTTSASAAPGASSNTVLIPAGTTFRGKLQQQIDTKTNHDGDKLTIVASNGETVNAHLTDVHSTGLARKPSMTIVFDNVTMPDGAVGSPIDPKIENMGVFDAKTHHMRTLGLMAAGAMAGHMAASKAGKKHGGLAGAAGGYVLSQEMKTDVDVRKGTTIVLKFQHDVPNVTGQP